MTNKDYLFSLLRCAFGNAELQKENIAVLSCEVVQYLFKTAKRHAIFSMIAKVLVENDWIDANSEYHFKFRRELFATVYRQERFEYISRLAFDAFAKAEIQFIPLKGTVLKEYYPEPWMRTYCDIDILVKKEQLQTACEIMVDELGCVRINEGTHDVGFRAKNGVRVELHFSLNEPTYREFGPLKEIWRVARATDRPFQYALPEEYFCLYHIAHMAKHFVGGGFGIRSVVDLWVLEHRIQYDSAKLQQLIKQCGLKKFYNAVKQLAEVWLSQKPHQELSQMLEQYILFGGAYGTMANRVALGQAKRGGKLQYAISRIILPYDTMKNYYPILKQRKWLTPVYQIYRWSQLIGQGKWNRAYSELLATQQIDKRMVDQAVVLWKKLGL